MPAIVETIASGRTWASAKVYSLTPVQCAEHWNGGEPARFYLERGHGQ